MAECVVCQARAELMATYKGEVLCLPCIVERYPKVVSLLVRYLVLAKKVPYQKQVGLE